MELRLKVRSFLAFPERLSEPETPYLGPMEALIKKMLPLTSRQKVLYFLLVILISFLYYYSEITNYTQTASTELIVGFSWISSVILLVVCICIIRTTHSSTNEWEIYSVVVMLLMTVLALLTDKHGDILIPFWLWRLLVYLISLVVHLWYGLWNSEVFYNID